MPSVKWSPRVPKRDIAQLYASEAQGLLDEELVDQVGIALLLRCEDIFAVAEARKGRVRCPDCASRGTWRYIDRPLVKKREQHAVLLRCKACQWEMTWGDYQKSFRRKQLNLGGAEEAFRRYVQRYPRAKTPKEKMLLIDRLIHEFHYSLKEAPQQPTRSVAVNLIEGNLTEVMAFLDDLTYQGGRETTQVHQAWKAEASQWAAWLDRLRKGEKDE